MQARITELITSYNEDEQKSMQTLANYDKVQMLDEVYSLYLNASASNNFEAKVQALSALSQHLVDLRVADSDIFINPGVFQNPTETYLLQKAGSTLCFGPRNQTNQPMFGPKTDSNTDTFTLFNCTSLTIQNMIAVSLNDTKWPFPYDVTYGGIYCPSKESHTPGNYELWNVATGSDCKDSWSHVGSIHSEDGKEVIIGSQSTDSEGAQKQLVLACGDCFPENQCGFVTSKVDNVSTLFKDSSNQCVTKFNAIGLHPSLPASRMNLILKLYPWFTSFNLLVLTELYALKNNSYVLESCEAAKEDWLGAFEGLSSYYSHIYSNTDFLSDLNMSSLANYSCKDMALAFRTSYLNSTNITLPSNVTEKTLAEALKWGNNTSMDVFSAVT